MKSIIKTKLFNCLILLFVFFSAKGQFSPIVVNSTPVLGSCSLSPYVSPYIKVPTEALSGDNINLYINVPATSVGCVKKVTITNSSNLNFESSATPFAPAGTNIYTNASVLDPINGQDFNVIYKFPNGVTCNGAVGTFTVEFEVTCGSTVTKCSTTVSVKARAANYWTISKQYVTGNLVCGESKWRFVLSHSNPNSVGLGAYNIAGTITETSTLPIISGASGSVFGSCYWSGSSYVMNTTLKNCKVAGTIITNTANYNLTLGSGCETMTGSLSAVSAPLAAPNTSISFTKSAYSNSFISPSYLFFPGCQGYYVLSICNNGNVPWTNFTLTDNLSIPGINVTSVSAPGWTQTPGGLAGLQTFTNTSLILGPGECTYIYIYFTITGAISSNVTNTASLSYAGSTSSSSGGGGGGSCVGITCPVIPTALQNITATNTFAIKAPIAVPSIVKCNTPNPYIVPIKQVGNIITFRIQVGNKGGANYNGTITDAISTLPQNLRIVGPVGPVSYLYYPNQYLNYCGGIGGSGTPVTTMGSWNGNTTSPIFSVINLPGNCNLNQENVLVIQFDAIVEPQLSGSRTNTAVMGSLQGLANYTIDKTGELKIRKTASVSTVENGVPFNYTLTVTNMGSTPLNNVVVTDALPTCIQLNGPIVVKLGASGPIVSSSTTGSIVLTIDPAAVINPGQSFVITIPVKKISGTSCCNPMASATAKTVPDANIINAFTPSDQPACVTSISCCDIPGFTASLNSVSSPFYNNVFNLTINAGPTAVQELEVSMLDYHIVYSSDLCKPASLGYIGNIFSPNLTIGGLVNTNNNANSIAWGLGTPTVVNNTIRLSISKAAILALSCCNGTMYFCIKVRVKNVDCQVCEKILCGRISLKNNVIIWEPDPVDLGDVLFLDPIKKVAFEKANLDKMQQADVEAVLISEAISKELKTLEPAKANEFLIRLSKKPMEVYQEMRGKILCCPSVPTSSGGTIPVPKK